MEFSVLTVMHFQSLQYRLSSSCSWDSITVLWSKLADLKWFVQIINQRGGQSTNVFKGKDINFQKLGIGGLDEEFKDIFRRAFASRVFPPHIISKWGQHLVLYMDDQCTVACLTSQAFQSWRMQLVINLHQKGFSFIVLRLDCSQKAGWWTLVIWA